MTHKLLYAAASPYSCKVRMAAAYAEIALDLVATETGKQPPALMQANPLAKIPVLLVEGAPPVFDSRAITHYLDRISGGRLFPVDSTARTEAEVLESLCDGLCDALLAHVYERRYRPEAIVHQPWLEKQWARALRVLQSLEKSPPSLGDMHAGTIALRTSLGYLKLRFNGQWEGNCPRLVQWADEFDHRFPGLVDCLPA